MIDFSQEITVCAFRYALGRQTYIVSIVVDHLIENWDKLDMRFKELIHREIKVAIERGSAGMKMDVEEWNKLLKLEV